jgi:hypothetical protein
MKPVDTDHRLLLQRPIDEDTRILKADFCRLSGVPILIERWYSAGVTASSAVLLACDVARMDDDALRRFLAEQAGLDLSGSVTVCRRVAHVFVNFDFDLK